MVTLSEGQKATLSSQAIEFLSNIQHVPFAYLFSNFLTSPGRIPKLRQSINDKMRPIEEALIAEHNLSVEHVKIGGVEVFVVQSPSMLPRNESKIMLNAHGGAFVMGSAKDRSALIMAAELGVRVYSVAYTKSPEVQYPVARDEFFSVYRELLKKGPPGGEPVDPKNLYAMGSSSGAQILVSSLLLARERGLPMPGGGIYLCTPALDFTGAGDSLVFNAHNRDIMPVSLLGGMVSQNYTPVGLDPKDPLFSPIYAHYDASFPRTIITVGTRDFALSNGVLMFWKLKDAGVEVELLVSEGMWHGFNWEDIPEAIQARSAVLEFLSVSTP
ncbi:hypothetical protein NLG97_g1118 [Lecanicillium saksenae]|uniref:Uncharacterized protein n=1 Tax=Lecanicillium saksenae TaxID=468837 RepID=A0ACC1R7B0_9HYPO|nr:hypothetical protein NLG97_g1118 [Lecanicillium saksenae]